MSIREVPNGNKLASGERVAEGEEALSVLECVKTRTQFINELMEVSFAAFHVNLFQGIQVSTVNYC